MSASDDLAQYLRLQRQSKASKPRDSDSLATSDLLSSRSSSSLHPPPLKHFKPSHSHRTHFHSTLKPVREEHSIYSISAFLPDSKPTPKRYFPRFHKTSKPKKTPYSGFYDRDSIDTEALLQSSDEELEDTREISLPRQTKQKISSLVKGKQGNTRSSPHFKAQKNTLLEEIREKVREMAKPAQIDLKIPHTYPEKRDNSHKFALSSLSSLFQPPSDPLRPTRKPLEMTSVCTISILPKLNIHSTGSDFSLLEQFQSPLSRKSHLTDSSTGKSVRNSRENGKFGSPGRGSYRKNARLSVVQAVVIIQRAVRRFLQKHGKEKRPKSPIKTYEEWSSEHPLSFHSTLKRHAPYISDKIDPERATQSLYKALDQLTALKSLGSKSSSEETSFVLSESLETPLSQNRLSVVRSKESSGHRRLKSPEALDFSDDTDLLLHSNESLDLME